MYCAVCTLFCWGRGGELWLVIQMRRILHPSLNHSAVSSPAIRRDLLIFEGSLVANASVASNVDAFLECCNFLVNWFELEPMFLFVSEARDSSSPA